MLTAVALDALVPQSHPIRRIKPMVDRALVQMSSTFDHRIKDHRIKKVAGGRKLRYRGVDRNRMWDELTVAGYNSTTLIQRPVSLPIGWRQWAVGPPLGAWRSDWSG